MFIHKSRKIRTNQLSQSPTVLQFCKGRKMLIKSNKNKVKASLKSNSNIGNVIKVRNCRQSNYTKKISRVLSHTKTINY